MTDNPYEAMQMAVDIVNTSAHPTSKVAAAITGRDKKGASYSIACTNYWPPIIQEHFGLERIGGSSGTIHAETECILRAPYTEGASIFVTDPFCPNCAKNIAEAGVRTIYIDHKGFNKDFASRRGNDFESMSLQICKRAGISVFEIFRKEQRLEPILEIPDDYKPAEDSPITLKPVDKASESLFDDLIRQKETEHKGRKFALALMEDNEETVYAMTARGHAAIGYSMQIDRPENIKNPPGKYTFMQEPVNRLLMNAPRRGLKIIDGYLYSSRVPTAREQVNLIGAGLTKLRIGDSTAARDNTSRLAMDMIGGAGIIGYITG